MRLFLCVIETSWMHYTVNLFQGDEEKVQIFAKQRPDVIYFYIDVDL